MKNTSRKAPTPARESALETILLATGGTHLQQALDAVLKKSPLSGADRQFCADLAYGYFRQKERLEYILSRVLKKPEKLPRMMRVILAMAVYSLLFQDSVPDYPAIDQAVLQIKTAFGARMAGVANGSLRNIARMKEAVLAPEWYQQTDKFSGLALYYSTPPAIASLWREAWGEETALKLMKRSCQRPWTGIRLNPGHGSFRELRQLLLDGGAIAIGKYGLALPPGKLPEKIRNQTPAHWLAAGALSFQSAGSIRTMLELGLDEWRTPVWDCCAGSGNKTCALLEWGANIGLATDISLKRLRLLPVLCARLGLKTPPIARASAINPPLARWDGHILVDAPCSGLGVLARRPDIKSRSHSEGQTFAALQFHMLAKLQEVLAPGRELAYITCTLNPGENELLVSDIMAQFPSLRLERQWQTPPDHPWLEGMFGAKLKKIT